MYFREKLKENFQENIANLELFLVVLHTVIKYTLGCTGVKVKHVSFYHYVFKEIPFSNPCFIFVFCSELTNAKNNLLGEIEEIEKNSVCLKLNYPNLFAVKKSLGKVSSSPSTSTDSSSD